MSEGRLRDVFHWAKCKLRWAAEPIPNDITPEMVESMSELLYDGWTEKEVAALYLTTEDDVHSRVNALREPRRW